MIREEVIGDARLILGDCREVLPTLGRIDACISDPPYGIKIDTANAARDRGFRPHDKKARARDFQAVYGDDAAFHPGHLLEIENLVLWGANNYADKLPPSPCWFCWDRKADKAADSDITDCELAWVRGLPFKTVRKFSHMWAGFQRDSEVGERHQHPTQKPVALMEWCLGFFPDADVVLDPYMGSAPVGAACMRLGRRFVGIEIDASHYETALRRIEAEHRRPRLALPEPVQPARTHDLFNGAA